jgi:acetyltransferase-like isoleucine patch superfamily enzyme
MSYLSHMVRPYLRSIKIVLQHFLYRLKNVHSTTYIASGSRFSRDLVMGAHGYIGPGSRFSPGVKIGRYVMIGPEVLIVGDDHIYDKPGTPVIFSGRPENRKSTVINDDVWIASRVLILSGVTIGQGAIIGAGALVTKDVEPYSVVVGSPAKHLRYRFTEEERILHDKALAQDYININFCSTLTK